MKTLIFNGSPKRDGDTAALISAFTQALAGEVRIVSCYDGIAPCNDCRRCRILPGCGIQDGMTEVYAYLEGCDAVVLASPIWFSSLSGPLLNLASRLQTYFSARHFRGEPQAMSRKKGILILTGAEPGTEGMPEQNALTIMKLLNVERSCVEKIYSLNTDEMPARQDIAALRHAREVARRLAPFDKSTL